MADFHHELINQIKRLNKDHIWPLAREDDQLQRFRPEVFKAIADLGLTGMTTPQEWSGAGLNQIDLCLALGEISRASVSYAVTVSVSSMVQYMINAFGTNDQKKKFLPPLAEGLGIGAFALTESSAGSDAQALKTTAKKEGGNYILQGSKSFITSAPIAKTFVVMAKTSPQEISAFIVPADSKNLIIGKKEDKMGWRASPTCEISFNQCSVPAENLLGKEGQGLSVALSALDRGRITIAAMAIGLAQEALDQSLSYAQGRQQFGKAISDFQGIEFTLADMALEIEASRLLMEKAARLCQDPHCKREELSMAASMAKLKATDTAMKVTTDAVQIFGGVGYTAEYPVERMMRDAKVMQILEGTNQIQRIVISRLLKKKS